MGTFAFRAVDVAGVPSRGELEAGSKAQVTEQLRQRGLIVLDVSEKREAFKLESVFQRFKSVNLRELSVFSRQFATLIASGMPMLRSLYTLEDQTEDERLKNAIVKLRQDIEAGSSLADAMERQPGIFEEIASEQPGESAKLPLLTRITMGASNLVTGYWFLWIPVMIGAAVGFF